ncbi:hypothetical protein [Segniliparus rugosus]|uniref:Uncharacterized protein n=1 Tax=Segniliparus rugosus (strain ATCC BAA-974 / DSM 45345 / CCUG 50838 / CIP 108380 / JCM 13579 / CDC 945) TaxID=679197 RepID=U1N5F9_SEGRC|nr:hypothetical protein [Segniliparus rugosus]ERG69379.1 hypothetical protein HMPREF9336_04075 [Segniliparus rugosus ATCC BAA-974]
MACSSWLAGWIKVLEAKARPDLRRSKHPDRATGRRIAEVLRAVAKELEG